MGMIFSLLVAYFFFSSRRRHTRWPRDWSSDVCSSDLGESKESSNVAYVIRSIYKQGENTNNIELYLTLLSESIDYDGEYEEIELDDKVIYFAMKGEKVNSKVNNAFDFFGYIKSKDSNQGVRYIYVVTCFDDDDDCDYDFDAIEEEVKQLMMSIEFATKD